jgi:DUF1680 family protein
VPIDAVTIDDTFWAPRRRQNREVTIPSQHKQLWETGRFDNLLRVAGTFDGPFLGRYFNDSDVYKWLEAASWSLADTPDPELEQQVDDAIAIIEAAQQPDGYLNSYFALERANERWTDADLHEMYCAGHLFQAAVAHHRATGSVRLLQVATRLADYLDATFGPEEDGKRIWTDGHPEVEMGLVELARDTGEQRYLALARFLVDVRGHGHLGDAYNRFGREYHQDHQPFRDLDEIVGHAVRAVYLNAGVADIYAETGETALGEALDRLWLNMTSRKMYISGGIGSRYDGESFGENYELPNRLAYTETCAAIGSVMWSWRMLLIAGDARYADLIELQLYNAMLSGVSLDGEFYFYQNPLADEGKHRRAPWFQTACCPPNVARTLASLPGYVYTVDDASIWVHLYADGSATVPMPNGMTIDVSQRTNYPWDGEIELLVNSATDTTLRLRIPGWCGSNATISVNGETIEAEASPGSYAAIQRSWNPGDTVRLSLSMPVRRVSSHPYVTENTGRIALMRGPLLYCVEQADNPDIELRDLTLHDEATFSETFHPDLLGGVVTVQTSMDCRPPEPGWTNKSYRSGYVPPDRLSSRVNVTAIPYYAWANREPGRMRVWMSRSESIC